MDGGGSGAASVWLASAGSDDLRSLFIYLGFDGGAEDPGQLLAAAECFHCQQKGHFARDCPVEKAKQAAAAATAAKAAKAAPAAQSGAGAAAATGRSPSHERDGYTPGSQKDPAADQAARALLSSRHVRRPAGGQ